MGEPIAGSPWESNYVGGAKQASLTAEVGNARTLTVQLLNQQGGNRAARVPVTVRLSDVATGVGLAAAAPSGGVAVAGGVGEVVNADVAGKLLRCRTDATGKLALTITEATAKTFYVIVQLPDGQELILPVAFV